MGAAFEDAAERAALVGVDAEQVFRRQLDRRQRILDFVRDLPRHLRPGFQAMGAFELAALRLQLAGHAVERVDEPAQLVDGANRNPRVEVAARDALRRARQPPDRIGDALGQRQPERGAEQDEAEHREVHAAIEIVDLALDVALPQRRRHGQDPLAGLPVRTGVAAIRYGIAPSWSSSTKLGSRSRTMAR